MIRTLQYADRQGVGPDAMLKTAAQLAFAFYNKVGARKKLQKTPKKSLTVRATSLIFAQV